MLRGAEKVDHRHDMRLVEGSVEPPCRPITLYCIGQIIVADGAGFRARHAGMDTLPVYIRICLPSPGFPWGQDDPAFIISKRELFEAVLLLLWDSHLILWDTHTCTWSSPQKNTTLQHGPGDGCQSDDPPTVTVCIFCQLRLSVCGLSMLIQHTQ